MGVASAADASKPKPPSAKSMSATASVSVTAAAAMTPRDCVLFTVKAGKHWALGRMDVGGQCKRFLSQAQGRHWAGSLPLENKADDLGGVGSADGKWVAFFSNRSGALNLWLAKADGSGAEALTTEETDIAAASTLSEKLAFSPDSKFIAFVMHEDLWLMDLRDRSLVSLSKGQGVGALTWSPNSHWIAYVQGHSLYRIATSGAPNETLSSGNVNYPTLAWSGDSDKGSLLYFGRGLQRVSLDRKSDLLWPTLLTPNRVRCSPVSPDKGLVIATLSSGSNELFFADFGGKARKADQVTNGGVQDALFLPDGKGFLFLRQGRIWRCNLDGKQAKPITDANASLPWAGKLVPVECL